MIPVNFSSLANLGNVWNQAGQRQQQEKTLADLAAKNQPIDNYLQGPKGLGGGQGFPSPGLPPGFSLPQPMGPPPGLPPDPMNFIKSLLGR